MKALKLSITDEDGVVIEQYVIRDERELDGMSEDEREKKEEDNEPGVFYLNPDCPHLDTLPDDLGIFLNRVNAE